MVGRGTHTFRSSDPAGMEERRRGECPQIDSLDRPPGTTPTMLSPKASLGNATLTPFRHYFQDHITPFIWLCKLEKIPVLCPLSKKTYNAHSYRDKLDIGLRSKASKEKRVDRLDPRNIPFFLCHFGSSLLVLMIAGVLKRQKVW